MKKYRSILVKSAIWLTLSVAMHIPEAFAASASRPNVVVIMTDDQRLDTLQYMPKTQELIAAAGVSFVNALASYPVCSPSRATFLTGQYAHNHQVLGNALPWGGYHKLRHNNTLPVWLHDAGYKTMFIGKYLNRYGEDNPLEVPPGWDDWQAMVENRYYGFKLNENGSLFTFGGSEGEYQTDVFAVKAASAIRRHVANNSRQPFFLFIAPQAPHSGRNSNSIRNDPDFAHLNHPFGPRAMRHLDLFHDEPYRKSKAYNEKLVDDKPAHIQALARIPMETTYGIDAHYRAKLEMLQAVDDLVETVVTELRNASLLKNTLIVYTSDNGFFHGEHRIVTGKNLPYDEALRIPLLVRGPGFPAGSTSTQLVSNIDLAPTVVEVSGATPGRAMDGRSLVRLSNNPASGRGRSIVLEGGWPGAADEEGAITPIVGYHGVREEKYQYVEYETGDRELYYLISDSAQVNNRIDDPKLAEVATRMQELLRRQENCRASDCSRGTP